MTSSLKKSACNYVIIALAGHAKNNSFSFNVGTEIIFHHQFHVRYIKKQNSLARFKEWANDFLPLNCRTAEQLYSAVMIHCLFIPVMCLSRHLKLFRCIKIDVIKSLASRRVYEILRCPAIPYLNMYSQPKK